ncbi:endo-1,4-beta-xylanase [Paraflavisolibacter sp. H34]|uniref:endo-1,4-beta-xylanase n=1 Tax=Huijunlia imazamoxiresistens TaxID=3127457 RepID=UPI00301670D1
MLQRSTFALALAGLLLAGCSAGKKAVGKTGLPSLRETFRQDFVIGTALNAPQAEEKDAAAAALVPRQFGALTPENVMKAALLHPQWDRYNFEQADKLVAYAQKHGLQVNGHTLIWHSQLPFFMRRMQSADSVRRYFADHITTVANRYAGKVYSWDVVNEALNEDGSLRKSIFLEKLGPDYIVEAFRLAQKAAPQAKLYYNDYNIEQPAKRAGAIALVKKLQAAGVRIDGVGIQGHWAAGRVPLDQIEASIREFAALGVEVLFTELDLTVLPNPWDGTTADIGQTAAYNAKMNPYAAGLPDSVQASLTRGYEDLFRLFLKHSDKISRVTLWGVHDGQSWLNDWPIRGRTNYPLLFDRKGAPKPAFFNVVAVKTPHPRPLSIWRGVPKPVSDLTGGNK